jgi:RNA polymerase sporulation-specific sigma factor
MGRLKRKKVNENKIILMHVKKYIETQDPDSFDIIIKSLDGYFQHLIYRKFFKIPGHNADDLYQEALLALSSKAIPDYREEKGPFISFAKLCVRRHIITILKASNNNKYKPLNGSISIDQQVSDCNTNGEDGPMNVGNFISSGEEGIIEKMVREESFQRIKRCICSKLTSLENDVLDLYSKNMSYCDIVSYMNKSRRGNNRVDTKTIDNALCRIKKKAIEILQESKKNKLFGNNDSDFNLEELIDSN